MTSLKKRKGGKAGPIVEINMIPLIDVSLVLLIIFMVMTPFLVQQQISVNLPHAVAANQAPDRPIVIVVQREGELTLNGKAISASELEASLKPLIKDKKDQAVLIQADRETELQKVISVMDITKRLDIGKLGISVEQPKN